MATESTEMYLAAIYRLTLRAPHAKVSDIAASLRISLPQRVGEGEKSGRNRIWSFINGAKESA